MADTRKRDFFFTLNNYSENDVSQVEALFPEATYLIYGKEVGKENGTPHLQGYFRYSNARYLKAITKKVDRWHLEVMQTNPHACINYCKKECDYKEFGDPPLKPEDGGKIESARWNDIRENAKRGKFDELPADYACTHFSNAVRMHAHTLLHRELPDLATIKGYWVSGPSGVGKSRWARTHAAETNQRFYLKENEDLKWWDGYTDEEIVLIEEWDPNMTKYVKWLKQLVDHYAVTVQTKGGMIKIRPKEVIITSNYSLEDCFRGLPPVELEALNRRFERITF